MELNTDLAFFEALAAGALAITPNRRLSNTWQLAYANWRKSQGDKVWPRASLLPWNSWLTQSYQNLVDRSTRPYPILLNKHQQRYLWQNIIKSNEEQTELLHIAATTQTAIQAWDNLQNWCLSVGKSQFDLNRDSQAFYAWSQEYTAKLSQLHCIDATQIWEPLIEHWRSHPLSLANKIVLVGFNEFTPQQQAILDVLQKCVTLETYASNQQAKSRSRISLSNCMIEWTAMARWAKKLWLEDTTATIACVIPDLQMQREKLLRVFQQQLGHDFMQAVNISAGQILTSLPIVASAFDILSIDRKRLDIATLSRVIQSPFITEAPAKRYQRSAWDLTIRESGEKNISIQSALKLLPQADETLSTCLQTSPISSHLKKPLAYWANEFSQRLQHWGWPAKADLSSLEQQAIQGWFNLLNEYIKLDIFENALTYREALTQLQNMANHTDFHFASPVARVQILGVLEAAGLPFDYIWISGMDDEQWPPYARANPFIPQYLQIEYDMPHASANRELHFCENLILNFTNSCKHIIFSYAQTDANREKKLSPLIADVAEVKIKNLALAEEVDPYQALYAQQDLEYDYDNLAPALLHDECINGGSEVLRLQAACPFRAFAKFRLGAESLPQPSSGLSAAERGMLLHQCLEKIWGNIQSQQKLLSLSQNELSKLVLAVSSACINDFAKYRPYTCHKKFIELEQVRMQQLLMQWLDIEKNRPPFEILAQEKKILIDLAGTPFHLRVDRIDSCENGKKIIIDYKTSLVSLQDWFSDRPNEPQLPLYAISVPEIAGILFAQVRLDQMRFQGLSEYDFAIEGTQTLIDISDMTDASSWEAQLDDWQKIITQLATEFSQGFAAVDPKDSNKTCAYCDLPPLCRIHEQC